MNLAKLRSVFGIDRERQARYQYAQLGMECARFIGAPIGSDDAVKQRITLDQLTARDAETLRAAINIVGDRLVDIVTGGGR